jgi:hypothetical protein
MHPLTPPLRSSAADNHCIVTDAHCSELPQPNEPDIPRSPEPVSLAAASPSWRQSRWAAVFSIDVRSLAALRIVLALTVLVDLGMRASELRVHYSDEGVLPRQVLLEHLDTWLVSLALGNGTPFFAGLLFSLTAIAAAGLLLGYRTRLMTGIVWVMVSSIQWRNPFIGSSGDALLRLLLFWSLFLPLGAVWSLDRRWARTPPASMRVLSLGTAGLLLQIAFMYWFAVLLKSGQEWRVDGTALYYAFSIQELATPLAATLLQFPTMLKALTFLTLSIETVAPLLLFVPVATSVLRLEGIVAIISLHVGIWLTLTLGLFPWIAAACMVCFLPSAFWDWLLPRWHTALARLSAVSVTACQTAVRWAPRGGSGIRFWPDSLGGLRSLALAARSRQTDPGPSGRSVAGEDGAPPMGAPLLLNLVAGLCLVYVLIWNVTTVSPLAMSEEAHAFGSLLGLVQAWTMFAPYPLNSSNWYSIPGTLRNGEQIDLMPFVLGGDPHRLTPVSGEKPQDMAGAFAHDEHWRKYFENLRDAENASLLLPLGHYLCREWNAANGGTPLELGTVQIIYNWELTLPDNQRAPIQRTVQWTGACGDQPAGP